MGVRVIFGYRTIINRLVVVQALILLLIADSSLCSFFSETFDFRINECYCVFIKVSTCLLVANS